MGSVVGEARKAGMNRRGERGVIVVERLCSLNNIKL